VRVLDVGCGANLIYPLLGAASAGWRFVGSDVTDAALDAAARNAAANPHLAPLIELRHVEADSPHGAATRLPLTVRERQVLPHQGSAACHVPLPVFPGCYRMLIAAHSATLLQTPLLARHCASSMTKGSAAAHD